MNTNKGVENITLPSFHFFLLFTNLKKSYNLNCEPLEYYSEHNSQMLKVSQKDVINPLMAIKHNNLACNSSENC